MTLRELLPEIGRRTLVMGVLNVTPDSFSDGGHFLDVARAVAHAHRMVAEGADILDVGGESTRPGALPVTAEEEIRRIVPVVERLAAEVSAPISLDTTKAAVVRAGVAAGARIVNDISAGTLDPEMLPAVAALGVPYGLMHLPVPPQEMGWSRSGGMAPEADVIAIVADFLSERVAVAEAAGIPRASLFIDPGFGFGKSVEQNLALIRQLSEIRRRVDSDLPVLMGTSRKSTLGRVLGRERDAADPDRLAATAATVALAISSGADIVRVHDVAFMVRVARTADAIVRGYDEQQGRKA